MTIKNVDGLQWPLTSVVEVGSADLAGGAVATLAFIPDNAIIVGISTHVDVAFNQDVLVKLPSGSTAATIKLAADSVVAGYPKFVAAGGTFTASAAVAPTTGHAYVRVEYVIPGRANESTHG